MIFTSIIKNWRLIIDIIIVLAIVLLIFLWNPFGLFGGGIKLQNTANMVSEIKEIGELVTAEYYGEVIASNEEAELEILDIDSIEILGETFYVQIKSFLEKEYLATLESIEDDQKIQNTRSERRKRKRINDKLSKRKKETIEDLMDSIPKIQPNEDVRYSLILFIGEKEHSSKIKVKRFVKKEARNKGNYINGVLKEVLTNEYNRVTKSVSGDVAYTGYVESGFQTHTRYTDFFYEYIGLAKPRKERKMDLAIIGRGSVKAGFKFNELNEENFVYDENNKIIYFFGFNAEILNQDINPWFIPERRVPGFQIIAERNATFEKMKEIKIHCINKLVYNAQKAGILEQAQMNGEEALKEFFSLLTGDEIEQVIFRQDVLTYHSEEILKDSIITFNEIVVIDSIFNRSVKSIEKEKNDAIRARKEKLLRSFLTELTGKDIVHSYNDQEERFAFNMYNRHIPLLLRDSIVTKEELDSIGQNIRHNPVDTSAGNLTYRKPPTNYWYWYNDSLNYLQDFNKFVDELSETGLNKGFYQISREESLDITLSNNLRMRDTQIIGINTVIAEKEKNLQYDITGNNVRFFRLDSLPAPDYLRYPLNDSIRDITGQLITTELFVNEETKKLDSARLKDELASRLFIYDSSSDSLRNSENLASNRDEIEVLGRYITERSAEHNNIGPILRARRAVDRFVKSDGAVSGAVDKARDGLTGLAENVRNLTN